MSYILLDINARDPFVSTSEAMMLEDTKVVVQSVWRLMTTEEGEIPNFREYGLNVKQFSQAPLTRETANNIYLYIKGKITKFEQRATIVHVDLGASFAEETISITLYIRVNSTGEVVQIPTWTIKLNALAI